MDYLYHKLVIVITRQEPALEFVLLHIINRWHNIDFWAKVLWPMNIGPVGICDPQMTPYAIQLI